MSAAQTLPATNGLVTAERLVELIFDAESRPHVETIKQWARERKITSIKLGRNVFFDPDAVRAEINEKRTIKRKK